MRLSRKEMILSREKKEAIAVEKRFNKIRIQLRKIAKNAVITYEGGWVCLTYPNGQVYKCRGACPESVFGRAK